MIRALFLTVIAAVLVCDAVAQTSREVRSGSAGIVETVDGRTIEGALEFDPVSGIVRIKSDRDSALEFQSADVRRVFQRDSWFAPVGRIADAGQTLAASPPAFVEIIVAGPLSLFATPSADRRLLISSRDGLIELRRTDEQSFDDFRQAYVSMDAIDVLRRRTDDCLVTQRNIGLVTFDEFSIEDHVRRYNDCIDRDAYPYRRYFTDRDFRIRISGGMSFQSAEQSGATWDEISIVTFKAGAQASPQLAVGLELHFPRDPAGRFLDLQLSGRHYSFADKKRITSGCRWDLDCPDFTDGEYSFVLDRSELRLTDVELLARGHMKLAAYRIAPIFGAGVAVQIPVSRQIKSTGMRTYRSFSTGEIETAPQEYDVYMGRYFLTSVVLSGRVNLDRFSFDVSALHFVRPIPRIEEVAPRRPGYSNVRFALGFTI
jgi:hypothetical protein